MGVAISPKSNRLDQGHPGAIARRSLDRVAPVTNVRNQACDTSRDKRRQAAAQGVAEIVFALSDGVTRLGHLYERNPLRVLFPAPEAGDLPVAALVTTSGGLVAGDRVDIAVDVRNGAAAHITGSAAEKVYRSTEAVTRINQSLGAERGAWLEFLPPETILFNEAKLRRKTRVELEADAGFLGGGIIVFGRIAMGERFSAGFLHDGWEVYCDGRLIWGDALHLDGDVAATMADPACFAGAEACATLVLVPPGGDPRAYLDEARTTQEQSAQELRAGVTAVNGVLVARWLGPALQLRRAYAAVACHLRQAVMNFPARLPRLWHV